MGVPRSQWRVGCSGKMVFVTRGEARQWAKGMSRRYAKSGKPYQCAWCRYWHLTTMRAGVAKQARRMVRRESRRFQVRTIDLEEQDC